MPTVVVKRTGSITEAATALRRRERRWLLAASLTIAFGLWLAYSAKTEHFDEVRIRLDEGTLIDLNTLESAEPLLPFLTPHYTTPADRRFAADHILEGVRKRRDAARFGRGKIPNVGYLNVLAVDAKDAYEKGGDHFKERVVQGEGFTPDLFEQEVKAPRPYPARQPVPASGFAIAGRVIDLEGKPMPGTLVTLAGSERSDTLRTGEDGAYAFTGLAAGRAYTVRPLKRYYTFREGIEDSLTANVTIPFRARAHRPTLLLTTTFTRLKPTFLARTPGGFNKTTGLLALVFFGLFWGIHIFWTKRRFAGDPLLLPVVLMLLGLSFIFMLGMPDPLRDRLLVNNVVWGSTVGGALLLFTSQIDVQRWGYRLSYGSTKSFLWLGLAALGSLALLTLGTGPAGSGAKVNLFGFQPMEAIKASLLVFFAGYFARNWEFLRELEQHGGLPNWVRRLRLKIPRLVYVLPIIFGVGVALLFFYFQSDLGPALVICTTFLILYGIVRRRWLAVGLGFGGLVTGFWLCYKFELVGTVVSRIRMMLSPWDNVAQGGEHLAHAFWALTAGGLTGQGIGEGSPLTIPAAHTDMIVAAIGEELGFLGIVAVLVLYAVLLQRGLTIALRTGSTFSFFLGTGIVIATALQLVLITSGMLGLIPLSGVVSPLLSYGMAATIMHLVFLGILFSLSARPGNTEQQQLQRKRFARPLSGLSLVIIGLLGLLGLRAAYIQIWQANDWIIKPALVKQADNRRGFAYNPRVLQARNLVPLGTIFDRNGIPLATSDLNVLDAHAETLENLGVDLDDVRAGFETRRYPFGIDAFYLLGDFNRRVKWGATNALYAENRYLSRLRGYDNHPETVDEGGQQIIRFDYAALLPLVRHGPDHRRSRRFLRQNRDLHLTIDIRLQQRVAEAISDHVRGTPSLRDRFIAAAVLDVATGDVLASVTYPLPDGIYDNPRNPNFFDRAAYAAKAPGSTFKLATAMAAFRTMGDEAAFWKTTVHANDQFKRRSGPTGEVEMELAIENSSNVYFARLAEEVRANAMLDVIDSFGFTVGSHTLTRRQKLDRLRALKNLAQSGFGQGELIGSPLLVARLSATIANDGAMPPVTWVHEPDNPPEPAETVITPGQARLLGRYMRRVVIGPRGTAKRLGDLSVPVAGKTGTAEQAVFRNGRRRGVINHAWFTGYAPYRELSSGEPQIAVAVLVEAKNSDLGRVRLGGGSTAAPIAGSIIEEAVDLGLVGRTVATNQ
ncbi:MAG: FtsW/RodA/SpoVE family cell cycle protein [Rhodothermales bacterium]